MAANPRRARAWLADFARRVDDRLEDHFARWRADVPDGDTAPTPRALFDAVADLTLRGGKRLRAALAYAAGLCADPPASDFALLDAASSLELLQSALLIHDDIMDRDEARRGGPTVHVAMTCATGDPHRGTSLAILAGSLGVALAQRLLNEAGLAPDALAPASAELARMQELVIYGQHLDLIGGVEVEVLQALKTTSYTTLGPVRLGARVSGASADCLAALEAYARPLGRAFQTRDDLLGVFGDAEKLGKPVGADLREGKRTELLQLALERSDEAGRSAIRSVLGQREASADAVSEACAAITASGARAELEALVQTATEEALRALDNAALRPAGVGLLAGIAAALASRDR